MNYIIKIWGKIQKWSAYQQFAFTLIISGLLVMVFAFVGYCLAGYLSFFGDISPTLSGQFGDFVGGLVGSLWALAGILLFYEALKLQRRDLNNQKEELQKTRQEFELSRMTDVFFRQLDITLPIIQDFIIIRQGETQGKFSNYKGKDSFNLLNRMLDKIDYQVEEDIDQKTQSLELSKEEQYLNLIVLLNTNNNRFIDLSTRLYSIKKALESFVANIKVQDKNVKYLKMLYWNNLGTSTNEVLVKLKPTYDNYKTAENYSKRLQKLEEKDQYDCINRINQFVSFFKVEEYGEEE